jgi:hypothetical protein
LPLIDAPARRHNTARERTAATLAPTPLPLRTMSAFFLVTVIVSYLAFVSVDESPLRVLAFVLLTFGTFTLTFYLPLFASRRDRDARRLEEGGVAAQTLEREAGPSRTGLRFYRTACAILSIVLLAVAIEHAMQTRNHSAYASAGQVSSGKIEFAAPVVAAQVPCGPAAASDVPATASSASDASCAPIAAASDATVASDVIATTAPAASDAVASGAVAASSAVAAPGAVVASSAVAISAKLSTKTKGTPAPQTAAVPTPSDKTPNQPPPDSTNGAPARATSTAFAVPPKTDAFLSPPPAASSVGIYQPAAHDFQQPRPVQMGAMQAPRNSMPAASMDVDPNALAQAFPTYAGKTISFVVDGAISLDPNPKASNSLALAGYDKLDPVLNRSLLEKWLSLGHDDGDAGRIRITGVVRPEKRGERVLIDVTDLSNAD